MSVTLPIDSSGLKDYISPTAVSASDSGNLGGIGIKVYLVLISRIHLGYILLLFSVHMLNFWNFPFTYVGSLDARSYEFPIFAIIRSWPSCGAIKGIPELSN